MQKRKMRPTISETLVGGRSRKVSSANVTDSYVAGGSGSALLGPTPSMEELHAPSTSAMTYFLADEATVNAASMTKSSDSLDSTGVFGVQSLSSSRSADTSGTGNFGKEILSVTEHKGVVGKEATEYGDEGDQEGEGDGAERGQRECRRRRLKALFDPHAAPAIARPMPSRVQSSARRASVRRP